MTSVKYFSSSMSGAPSLANVAGNLISVLDACLVDGFGLQTVSSIAVASGVGTVTCPSNFVTLRGAVVLFAGATGAYTALNGQRKVTADGTTQIFTFDATGLPDGNVTGTVTVKHAPAGWLKAFSGTNLAAYKSANVQASGAYLRVADTGTTTATVRGYEAMTDVNNGTGLFPATAQQATCLWPKSNSAAAKNWWIIANDQMVYFGVAFHSTYPTAYNIYGFGDMTPRRTGDPYRAVLCALNSDPMSSYPSGNNCPIGTISTSGASIRYSPRSFSGLGSPPSLTPTWLDASSSTGNSGYTGRAFPNSPDNAIIFSPILMLEGSSYRGEMTGCFATPQSIQQGIADGTVIDSVANFNRQVVYRQWQQSNNPTFGGVFFDLTGPWGS